MVVTDLVEGTGPAAKAGDVVLVNYVGVRSADGTEFDNSYDRGEPFSVTLGAGMVIQGWDDGLVGIKQGGRRQLDIPADLAYGDNPQGGVIQPGDALTFVVDAVALVSLPDASQAPAVTVTGGAMSRPVRLSFRLPRPDPDRRGRRRLRPAIRPRQARAFLNKKVPT